MQLFPHLHLLVPSSTPGVLLEARLYIAHASPKQADENRPPSSSLPISTSSGSRPTRYNQLSSDVKQALSNLGIDRMVTAAHPWGRLGGNMLDPSVRSFNCLRPESDPSSRVIAESLLSCLFPDVAHVKPISTDESRLAVITYNVRGVGHSQGRSPLITVGNDPDDFAAVENAALQLLGGSSSIRQVHRMVSLFVLAGRTHVLTKSQGYSWGCLSAVLAPLPQEHQITSYLLVSPALSAFKALAYLTRSFHAGLASLMPSEPQQERQHVWMVYGTADQFTGIGAFRSCVNEFAFRGIRGWEVEVADHFFRSEAEGQALENAISAWVCGGSGGKNGVADLSSGLPWRSRPHKAWIQQSRPTSLCSMPQRRISLRSQLLDYLHCSYYSRPAASGPAKPSLSWRLRRLPCIVFCPP